MERLERIFILHRMLSSRRTPISRQEIEAELECSRATVTRTIATMRDWLGAPIVFDAEQGGYRYAQDGEERAWEMPGLWFRLRELKALAAVTEALEQAVDGTLADELGALRERIAPLLNQHERDGGPVEDDAAQLDGDNVQAAARALADVARALRTGARSQSSNPSK